MSGQQLLVRQVGAKIGVELPYHRDKVLAHRDGYARIDLDALALVHSALGAVLADSVH